jgi:hypothetical protein
MLGLWRAAVLNDTRAPAGRSAGDLRSLPNAGGVSSVSRAEDVKDADCGGRLMWLGRCWALIVRRCCYYCAPRVRPNDGVERERGERRVCLLVRYLYALMRDR